MDARALRPRGCVRGGELDHRQSAECPDRDRAAGARLTGVPCRATQPRSSVMNAATLLRSAAALLCVAGSLAAQASTFVLTTTNPTYRAPAFIGNGAFSLVGAPLGTTPSLSFAAGVYDHAPGDVPRIAALPAWNELDVSDGDGWLNDTRPDTSALQGYRQTLDLYDGTLSTSYEWVHGAKRTAVEVTAFVSRADANLAVIRVRLVPQYAGRVTLRFPLREWPRRRRLALARLERSEPQWTPTRRLGTPGGRRTSPCRETQSCSASFTRCCSTCSPARARARTRASRRWDSRARATTGTYSGTRIPGCFRPCSCSIPRSPARWWGSASARWVQRAATPPATGTAGRCIRGSRTSSARRRHPASRGRTRCTRIT